MTDNLGASQPVSQSGDPILTDQAYQENQFPGPSFDNDSNTLLAINDVSRVNEANN